MVDALSRELVAVVNPALNHVSRILLACRDGRSTNQRFLLDARELLLLSLYLQARNCGNSAVSVRIKREWVWLYAPDEICDVRQVDRVGAGDGGKRRQRESGRGAT
jgi:hypothetical protein